MNRTPVIGLTPDIEKGGYAPEPWYALRTNYCSAIVKAGGAPIVLSQELEIADTYLQLIDGLVVTGGMFDIDPSLYGAGTQHESVTTKSDRTEFEMAMIKGALTLNMPVLGICGGEQLLAVALGGALVQDIEDEIENALKHMQENEHCYPSHDVEISEGTLLHQLTGVSTQEVNSVHHQAVASVPDEVVVSARSSDGVIEAIEVPERRFCLGLQWHPEFDTNPGDGKIFSAFIDAAADN